MKKRFVIFDTETSGLPPSFLFASPTFAEKLRKESLLLAKKDAWTPLVLSVWPSILQLSFLVVEVDLDTNTTRVITWFDSYIDIPEDVIIDPRSTEVHHITRENIASKPNHMPIELAMEIFVSHLISCDEIVAHNAAFDRKMVLAELLRIEQRNVPFSFSPSFDIIWKEMFESPQKWKCTMETTVSLLKIPFPNRKPSFSSTHYKFPKLIESYSYFFDQADDKTMQDKLVSNLHNSMIDVFLCARVYLEGLCHYRFDEYQSSLMLHIV